MSTIRTAILSIVLMLVLAAAVNFVAPLQAKAAASCPGPVAASSLSTQQLRAILNGRYEHRVGMPR